MPPIERKPRWVSPRTGCSTLMTSAPQSARIAPAAGTKVDWATSRTRTPSITLITIRPPGRFVSPHCAKRNRKRRRGTEGLTVDVRVVVGDQLDFGQSVEQAFERDPGLHPGQVPPEAGVLACGK